MVRAHKRINVLYITHYPDLYGANLSLLSMINAVKDAVNPIVVIPAKGPICEKLDAKGIPYCVIPFAVPFITNRARTLVNLLKICVKICIYVFLNIPAYRKLRKCVKNNHIQIVHSNTSLVTVGHHISKLMGLKHVWHIREFQDKDYHYKSYQPQRLYRKRLKRTDAVICVSKALAEYFAIDNKAKVLYDPIIVGNSFRKIVKENYFLFCGLVLKSKGIEDLIQAFGSFLKLFPDYRLLIAGNVDSQYKNFLTEKTKENGSKEKVCFLGHRNDVMDLMSSAKALIMSSKNEAMGRVTIEAMMNYCVVIGYNNAGTAELIANNKTGLLYDTIEELVSKMAFIAENEDKRNFIEDQAFTYSMNTFTEEKYGEAILSLYTELLKK